MSDNASLHVVVNDHKSDGCTGQSEDEKGQDKECSLLAGLLGRLRNSEGVDEGVGEKVDETHNSIMLCGQWFGNFESRRKLEHLFVR